MKAKPNDILQRCERTVDLKNYFEFIAIYPSNRDFYYFLLLLKAKEINFETQRTFDTEFTEAKLEGNQNRR